MSEPRIRTFNPGTFQSDAELSKQFVVRTDAFTTVLDIIRGTTTAAPDEASRRHILLTGRRGYGKTMLLARVAAELRAHDSERLIPVRFTEESYEIFTLKDFWLDVLFYLALELGASAPTRSRHLLSTRNVLAKDWQGAALGDRAYAAVLDAAAGRTLVLMVENLQDLCTSVDAAFESELRAILLAQRNIILLATAVNPFALRGHSLFPTAAVPADLPWSLEQSPLYDLFRVVDLQPLDNVDCRLLWTTITGTQLRTSTDAAKDPARALHILTGGNPRLLVMIANLVRHRSLHDFTEALVDLVDSHTDYFRGQLDNLAKTERRVYLAVVDIWTPSTPSQISERARIAVRTVSAMLARLAARGMVFRTKNDGTAVNSPKDGRSTTLYFAADGLLYNAYYKLRRERDAGVVTRTVVRFMTAFYSPQLEPHDELYEAVLSEAEYDHDARRHDANNHDPVSTEEVLAEPEQAGDGPAGGDGAGDEVHAQVLFNKGAYRELFVVYRNNAAPVIQALVAKAMHNIATHAYNAELLEKPNAAIAIWRWGRLIRRYSDSIVPQVMEQVGEALLSRAHALERDFRLYKSAIASCLECERRLEHRPEVQLQGLVARSMERRLEIAGRRHDHEGVLCIASELVRRYGGYYRSIMPEPTDSTAYKLRESVHAALYRKGVAHARQGNFVAAVQACEDLLQRGEGKECGALDWARRFGNVMVEKGIYLARLGRLEEAMRSWGEVVRRVGPDRGGWAGAADERATRLLCVTHLKLGRVEKALSIYDASWQARKEVPFFFRLRMFGARLAVKVGKWRRNRRAARAAAEELRVVYGAFDPDNDTMMRMIVPPVIELIAMGASEGEVLDILVSDEKKAAVLWPLIVALQQRLGESVLQPTEVMAIAADVNEQIEARKAGSVT